MEVKVRRNRLSPQALDDLDHAGHAGGGLKMADIRLHRADQQRLVALGP